MNKKIYIFAVVIVLLFCVSCTDNRDYVLLEFSWLISEKTFLKQPSAGDKDWYLVYDLTMEQLDDILKNDFKDHEYQGWKRYKRSRSIGVKESIHIEGYSNNVMINLKKGSDAYNQIAMFVDITEKKLILFYGITYGM